MPTTIESYKNTKYGAAPQFGKVNNGNGVGDVPHFLEKEQTGPRAGVDPDAPGIPGFPGFEAPVVHPNKKPPTNYVPETKTSSEESEAPKKYGFKSVGKQLVKSLKKEKGTLTKSGAPFKLRSGNTSAFKMMGSSPAQFFGGLFGGGGTGIRGIMDKIRAKREAKRAKRLGLTATAPGGGGEGGSHTHGTGGEAIGGAQAVTAAPAAPEMPAEELDEAVV